MAYSYVMLEILISPCRFFWVCQVSTSNMYGLVVYPIMPLSLYSYNTPLRLYLLIIIRREKTLKPIKILINFLNYKRKNCKTILYTPSDLLNYKRKKSTYFVPNYKIINYKKK